MNQVVPLTMRDKIFAIEDYSLANLPQVEIPTKHYFSPGLYAREITVPPFALITGVIHKHPQINILSKGIIRVTIGEDIAEIAAPNTVVSPAGVKRLAYTLTEVVWTTIVHTFLTDLEEIEKEFFAYSEKEYEQFVRKQLEWQG